MYLYTRFSSKSANTCVSSMKQINVLVCLLLHFFGEAFAAIDKLHQIEFETLIREDTFEGLHVSEACSSQLNKYAKDLSNMQTWALKMFDSSGQVPAGVIGGNYYELGSFQQCLKIAEGSGKDTIFGKYCMGKLTVSVKNVTESVINLGVCMPRACKAKEIQSYYKDIKMLINEDTCQTEENQPKLDFNAQLALAFLGLWACLIVISTVYDMIMQSLNRAPAHWALVSFSCYTNAKRLSDTTVNQEDISCLHGLRVISVMLVIMAHHQTLINKLPIQNGNFIKKFFYSHVYPIVLGGNNAITTLFFMNGLILSYIFMVNSKQKAKFSWVAFYVRRYLSLTPTLGVIIILHAFLVRHLGSGPLWPPIVNKLSDPCTKYWWTAVFYIQNFNLGKPMCVEQSWFLSVDMQLYVLSPLLLLTLLKKPKATLYATGCLTLFCIGLSYLSTLFFGKDSINLPFHKPKAPYAVAPAWLMGIILGYFVYNTKKSAIVLKKVHVMVLWAVAIAIILACSCLRFSNRSLETAWDSALRRPLWSLALGWVVFACHFGYGGIVNGFLSSAKFRLLSRISYSAFISHVFVQAIALEVFQMMPVWDTGFMLKTLWINYVMIFFFSVALTLAFGSPVDSISNKIWKTPTGKVRSTRGSKTK
ncbi:hypothetical protein PPYR_07915 [Photinus pyralis]|uniref:Nose resistant-to-fluoxetine protein N-terminal domain-containing protein n=1 Tax=Photinus pyralis TaxID=7054 RepID=A0A5N4ARR0_PHOPY|nr:nose resistant to fluoxetine protein 6-like [Photinus pyralis]KAB0800035.1 hypothetical protein PPYR_07915 [Photinus pyralis]